MITRQLYLIDSLTSESTPAGGNAVKSNLSHDERRLLEARARYARAELMGNFVSDALLWAGAQFKRLVARIKGHFKLRAAEDQLYRMSDRELADLGLCRADIPFAVRETPVEGVTPRFDNHYAAEIAAANRNTTPAILWAGRA